MKHELRKDALGVVHSIAMGVAGSAPSFSLSATLPTLIGAVAVLAPVSLLYCGLIMLGIVLAYVHLNAWDPNAGASYAWGSAVLGRTPGFLAGWALLVASVVFMVSATLPAGSATMMLIAPDHAESQYLVTACAAGWLILVTAVVAKGISLTGRLQSVMTAIELCVLAAISIAAAIQFAGHPAHDFAWPNLLPTAFTPSSFASGAVIALFFFWGWDVSLNLSEETRDSEKTPGSGALAALAILILAFAGVAAICLAALTDDEIKTAGTNILFTVAGKLFPAPWSYLAVLALMLSTIGTLQTQMLQFSRTMFAQARDGALDDRWSTVHHEHRTPHHATFLISGLGLLLLFGSLSSKGLADIMADSIQVIGVLAAYYYGVAGLSCAIHYRAELKGSLRGALGKVICPGFSALVLFWAAIMTLIDFDLTAALVAAGSVLLAGVPLWRHRPAAAPSPSGV